MTCVTYTLSVITCVTYTLSVMTCVTYTLSALIRAMTYTLNDIHSLCTDTRDYNVMTCVTYTLMRVYVYKRRVSLQCNDYARSLTQALTCVLTCENTSLFWSTYVTPPLPPHTLTYLQGTAGRWQQRQRHISISRH